MDRKNWESRISHPDSIFINGVWAKPSTDRKLCVVSPTSEIPLIEVAEAVEADVDRAVAAARTAFDEGPWPRLSPAERGEVLKALGREMEKRINDLAQAWIDQVGVVRSFAERSVPNAVRQFQYYGDLAATYPWVEERVSPYADDKALLVKEAVGVCATIAPWNAPLVTMLDKVIPALLTGCTVVMKPAPQTPLEGYIIAEAAEAAGLPPGVLNLLPADRAASDYLTRHAWIDKVAFTGSTAVGRRILENSANRIGRVALELGGKSAAIILDDYDVQAAAETMARAITIMCGQTCSNLSRILVPKSRHDDFVDAMSAALRSIKVGDPDLLESQMGPLTMQQQYDKVTGYFERGRAEGAKIATGGGRPEGMDCGFFVEPTLFTAVDNSMAIAQDEIFGPVSSVITYTDLPEAIRIANDTIYGLNGSVFTNDIDQAYKVSRAVRTGSMGHNGFKPGLGVSFGGFKQSGLGRESGLEGIREYCELKTIIIRDVPDGVAEGHRLETASRPTVNSDHVAA